jgi:asparagine synthase (glutamine-hydrolysing)
LLGWQIGDRTLFEGVRKLRDGERLALENGRTRIDRYLAPDRPLTRRDRAAAIPEAAHVLRTYLGNYLDEHPDAVLQLTGGIDSRILLAAIEPGRRRGLRALTLAATPASEDVSIATELTRRCGLQHLIYGFEALEALEPTEAFELARWAAETLDGMADPLAHAALSLVEQQAPQGNRISGLGGEVARGFYYMGAPVLMPVSRRATRVLTGWRMFANESVPAGVLAPSFAREVRDFATEDVYRTLSATQLSWLEATDHFYLYERMQRWAGLTATAVGLTRSAVNPMLDRRFLEIATSLPPRDKAGSRFLAGLLCHLDAELGDIPMDERRAPRTYADPSRLEQLTRQTTTLNKGYRKVRQRLSRSRRPAAGGPVLSNLVVRHWRDHPDVLNPARTTGLLDERWLDDVLGGSRGVEPSAAAFVTSLVSAQLTVD